MKSFSNKLLRCLLAVMAGWLLSIGVVYAEQGKNEIQERALNISLLRDDFSISSVFGYKDLYFNISPAWRPLSGSFLNLFLSYSSGLNSKLSGITVYLNGSPLYSMPLGEAGSWKESIKIPIPESGLRYGVNMVEIKGLIRRGEGATANEGIYVGWLKIHKESYVHLKYSLKESLGLKDFPSPYFEENVPTEDTTLFVLPDRWSLEELKSAIMMTLDWVRRSPMKSFIPKIVTVSELTPDIKERSHLVYLGRKEALSSDILKEFKIDESKLDDRIFISSIVNHYGKGRFLVTAEKGEGVIKGVKAILSKEIKRQMEGREAYIPLDIDFKLSKVETHRMGKTVYLGELASGDIIFRGVYSHSESIGLKIPPNWSIKEDVSLNLNLRYSSNLDERVSGLTVLVNGVPLRLVKLSSKGFGSEKVTISIPKGVFDQGYIYVTFNAYLDISFKDRSYNYPETAWLVIDKISYFDIPYDLTNLEPLLENFPYSITNGKIGVFIPEWVQSAALNTLAYCLIGLQRKALGPIEVYLFNLLDFSKSKIAEQDLKSVIILSPSKEAEEIGIRPQLGKITFLPDFLERATIWQVDNLRIDASEIHSLSILWVKEHPKVWDFSYEENLVQWNLKGNLNLLSNSGETIPFYTNAMQRLNPTLNISEPSFWELIMFNLRYGRALIGIFVLSLVGITVIISIALIRHKRAS